MTKTQEIEFTPEAEGVFRALPEDVQLFYSGAYKFLQENAERPKKHGFMGVYVSPQNAPEFVFNLSGDNMVSRRPVALDDDEHLQEMFRLYEDVDGAMLLHGGRVYENGMHIELRQRSFWDNVYKSANLRHGNTSIANNLGMDETGQKRTAAAAASEFPEVYAVAALEDGRVVLFSDGRSVLVDSTAPDWEHFRKRKVVNPYTDFVASYGTEIRELSNDLISDILMHLYDFPHKDHGFSIVIAEPRALMPDDPESLDSFVYLLNHRNIFTEDGDITPINMRNREEAFHVLERNRDTDGVILVDTKGNAYASNVSTAVMNGSLHKEETRGIFDQARYGGIFTLSQLYGMSGLGERGRSAAEVARHCPGAVVLTGSHTSLRTYRQNVVESRPNLF